MRSFAIAAIVALAAASPQYGYGDDNSGYGNGGYEQEHPVPSSSVYVPVAPSSTPAVHTTYEAPGGYPVYTPPTEHKPSSTKVEIKTTTKAVETHPAPTPSAPSSVNQPEAPKSSTPAVYPPPAVSTKVSPFPSESPCPSSTVTVTVTVPAGSNVPQVPSSKGQAPGPNPTPYYPTGPATTRVYQPTGTGVPTRSPTPPTFTGAASTVNGGLFVAGVGAFAALFL